MVFSKTFPREIEGSQYPRWEEMFLSAQEEREREQVARQENLYLIRQCVADARNVLKDEKLMDNQASVLSLALALFRKRASHVVYYKEEECKKKFQKYWGVPKKMVKKETKKPDSGSKKK